MAGYTKSAFAAINYSLPALLIGGVACAALFWGPYLFLAAGLVNHSLDPGVMIWLPLAQIALLLTSQLLLMRRFHLPLALAFLQAGTILAVVLTTLYAAIQTELGQGIVWKGRTYQFDALDQGHAPGARLARTLVVARLLIAALLIFSEGIRGRLDMAAALLLLAWTIALLEHLARRGATSRWAMWADAAGGLACLGFLQLSGLLPVWLTLLIALTLALGARWLPGQVVATMASVAPGAILLIIMETQAPNEILLGWFVLIALVVTSRSITQMVVSWLQRFRSS